MTCLSPFLAAQAQPTIVSAVPTNMSTHVSTTAQVVITFSETMDPDKSAAIFFNLSGFALLSASQVWSADNMVLTCTPDPGWPSSSEISWTVDGHDTNEAVLTGTITGFFETSAGTGTEGFGTNQFTSFGVGKTALYYQNSSAAPMPPTNIPPYLFLASITLSSNQSAIAATLELPSTSVSNLTQRPNSPGEYFLSIAETNQSDLEKTVGNGNYIFTLTSATSNEQVTVNFPSTLAQPAAPQVNNFAAAQSVNHAQPFTLQWSSFTGGTSQDFVMVSVGGAFSSPPPGNSGALPGTATSVVIPANTLQPGLHYDGVITFYHSIVNTNGPAGYISTAYRSTSTEFMVVTADSVATSVPAISPNASWNGESFSFNVTSAIGEILVVQYTTNTSFASSQWYPLFATTNTTGVVQINDSVSRFSPQVFYRVAVVP